MLAQGGVQLGVNPGMLVKPAVYDPVNDPEGAARADAYIANVAAQKAAQDLALRTLPPGFKLPKRALTVGGIFSQLEKYKTAAEKASWLRHNQTPALLYILRLAFEPVEWVIPKGLPPYKALAVRRGGRIVPLRPGQAPTDLMMEARRLYLFIKGGNDAMDRLKREKVFQQLIEDMESIEVDVLLGMKDKTFDRFVSKDTIELAFPGLFKRPFTLRFMR